MGSSVTTLTVIKGLPENLFQPRIVYAKTAARSFDHLLARDTTSLDGQPVAEAEFSDELPLRSPVSITKRMNGVHLTKVAGRPNGEVFEVTAREMPFALQFSAQLIEARNNVLVECEGVAGFRDIHSAKVSGPLVHVLKNMMMDRLKMPRVEPALYGLMFQFNDPPCCRYRLEFA